MFNLFKHYLITQRLLDELAVVKYTLKKLNEITMQTVKQYLEDKDMKSADLLRTIREPISAALISHYKVSGWYINFDEAGKIHFLPPGNMLELK